MLPARPCRRSGIRRNVTLPTDGIVTQPWRQTSVLTVDIGLKEANGMKILVVDDSRLQRIAIERALSKKRHEVISVADGRAGLLLARAELPSLILLDMMLPGLDGTCVLKALKQDPLTASIPVIVLTGLSQRNEAKLKQAGAAAYIEKASLGLDKSAETLISIVENAVGTSSLSRCSTEKHAPQAEANSEVEQTEPGRKEGLP